MKLGALLFLCGLLCLGGGFYTTSPVHTPQPQTVQFSEVRPRSARASWDWNITHPVKFFEVEVSQEESQVFVQTTAVLGHERSVKISHLLPNTKYRVTVRPRFFVGSNTRRSEVLTTPSDSVLLSRGSSRCSGSLEKFRSQPWNNCQTTFGPAEAAEVCEELDCGDVQSIFMVSSAPPPKLSHCGGTEASLQDCKVSEETPCATNVRVTCSDQILRLDGFRCYGNPRLRHKDEWRPVMTADSNLDLDFGSALCERIGCGSALSLERLRGFSESYWILEPECVKLRTGFSACLDLDSQNRAEGTEGSLFLLCSEAFPAVRASVSSENAFLTLGSNFTVSCSLEKPHVTKQLHLQSPTGNYTLPPVNHSAHFLFQSLGPAHMGNYTCSYCESFTSKDHCFQSRSVLISPGADPQEKTMNPTTTVVSDPK